MVGPQLLATESYASATLMGLGVEPFEDVPPSRVGFGYLVLMEDRKSVV